MKNSSSWPIMFAFMALCAAAFVYDARNAAPVASDAVGEAANGATTSATMSTTMSTTKSGQVTTTIAVAK